MLSGTTLHIRKTGKHANPRPPLKHEVGIKSEKSGNE